ncbi:MAG: HAE1 family hydrophobic/amphiphilic exporter-1 [Myxococcota bacterium]
MRLSDLSIDRPVLTWMMTAALATFGILGLSRLGIDRYPAMDPPFAGVVVRLVGASPSTMEEEVAEVLEETFATIEGVKHIYSESTHGAATVMVEFELEHDIDIAAQDMRDKLNSSMDDLPAEIEPPSIGKFDLSSHPIIYAPIASDLTQVETTEYVDEHVKPYVESIAGAAGVTIYGARERNIRIWIDPDALRARNLAITDVLDALRREHIERPGGFVEGPTIEWALKVDAEFRTVQELGAMVISWDGDAPIRLRDVARLEDGAEDVRTHTHMNGQPGVAIGVSKQSDGNTVAIVDEFKARIDELRDRAPPTIHISESDGFIDNSESIRDAFEETIFALWFGGFLAVAVVFVFVRRTRPTLIVALAIPMSVITTFGLIWMFDFTLNTMTLLGLTLAIGVVIDDAIIVLENIERHREEGSDARTAAIEGTREITLAAAAATFSVAAVFLPVAFAEGQMGSFLMEFGVTVAAAVIVSLFVALTLTPMLAARMPAPKPRDENSVYGRLEQWFRNLEERYRGILDWSLDNRLKTFGIAAAAIALAVVAGKQLPGEFVPAEDRGMAVFEFRTPPGTSLEQTIEMLTRNEAWLLDQPETVTTLSQLGGTSMSNAGPNVGFMNARLLPHDQRERSTEDFQRDAVKALSEYPGQEIVSLGSFGMAQRDLELEIRGHATLEELSHYSDVVLARMKEAGGVTDLEKEIKLGLPEARIVPDREKAATLGVDADTVSRIVMAMIGGIDVATFREGERRHDIRLRMEPGDRETLDAIGKLWVRARNGELVDLRNVVNIEQGATASTISRTDRQRSAEIMMNLDDGLDLNTAVERAMEIAEEVLPAHLSLELKGDAEDMKDAGRQFMLMLVLAVLVIYMVLAAQFESFTQPLIVMLALPFSMTGALGGLWIMGMSLNLFSMIGIVLLIGLVTKNSILLVDYANKLREAGASAEEAMRKAAPIRMRPVLMTALSMIFGVLPAAVGIGPGAETRAPMAVATAAGMFSSMLLTLLIVPVFYLTLESVRDFMKSPRENYTRWRVARSATAG